MHVSARAAAARRVRAVMTGAELPLDLGPERKAATLGEANYQRIDDDAYFTEPRCVHALLGHLGLDLPWLIAEPMCGDGAIVKVLEAAGHQVIASDLRDYGAGYPLRDLLSLGRDEFARQRTRLVITNVPYEGGAKFIAHLLWLTQPMQGLVAILLRHEYDCAPVRRALFRDHPAFACKLTLTFRPKWRFPAAVEAAMRARTIAEGKDPDKKNSPRFPFAWFIWNWQHQGDAALRYGP